LRESGSAVRVRRAADSNGEWLCERSQHGGFFRARVAGDRPEEKLSPLTELLQQKGAGEKKINKQLLGLRGERRVETKKIVVLYIKDGDV